MSIVWETPEPPAFTGRRRKDWAEVAAALRSAPGQWAVVDTDCAASTATQYHAGKNRAFPRGQFEFTVRGVKAGRAAKLYARYVGEVAS